MNYASYIVVYNVGLRGTTRKPPVFALASSRHVSLSHARFFHVALTITVITDAPYAKTSR